MLQLFVKLKAPLFIQYSEPAEIGVITPYKAQVKKIKDLLHAAGYGLEEAMVGSVEQFQGQVRLVDL